MEKCESSAEHKDTFHGKRALPSLDASLGQILDVHSTPEEERMVLLKLDLMYYRPCTLQLLNLNRG